VWYIIAFAGLAPIRRSRVTSNVRPRGRTLPRNARCNPPMRANACSLSLSVRARCSTARLRHVQSVVPAPAKQQCIYADRARAGEQSIGLRFNRLLGFGHKNAPAPEPPGAAPFTAGTSALGHRKKHVKPAALAQSEDCFVLGPKAGAPRARCALRLQPRPNPSVNARPSGGPPGPRCRVVHHRPRGPGVPPLVPRYLER